MSPSNHNFFYLIGPHVYDLACWGFSFVCLPSDIRFQPTLQQLTHHFALNLSPTLMESHRDIQYRHSQQRAVDEPTRSVSPSAAAAYSAGPQFASPHGSFSLSPNVTTSPAPTAPFPVQHLDEWRAVGQRRASQSALMPSGGYFTQKLMKRNLIDLAEEPFHDEQQRIFVSDMPVQTAPPGFDLTREAAAAQGIHTHDRRMSVQRDGGADVPIFQFFGGRAVIIIILFEAYSAEAWTAQLFIVSRIVGRRRDASALAARTGPWIQSIALYLATSVCRGRSAARSLALLIVCD